MRLVRVKDEPAQPGKAIQAKWMTQRELAKLCALIVKATKQGDLRTWRRGKAVWDYVRGKKVMATAAEFKVARGRLNPTGHQVRRRLPSCQKLLRPRRRRHHGIARPPCG